MIAILTAIIIYLLFLQRKTRKELSQLKEDFEEVIELKFGEHETYVIEKKEQYYLSSFKEGKPYESFIPMSKEEIIETLKEQL
jgi:hypothetical protein